MKITVLVGNGFDLNLGLHTSYKDFLKYYREINMGKSNKIIDSIKQDIDLWSDFELELGKISSKYGESEIQQYLMDCQDIINSLNNYLKIVSKKAKSLIDYGINEFVRSFVYIKSNLTSIEREKLSLLEIKPKYEVDFYNFNYTSTLYWSLGSDFSGETTAVYSNDIDFTYNLVQMHGTLSEKMSVGVDNRTQIKNTNFRDNKDLNEFLNKQTFMEYYKLNNYDKFQKSIAASNFIIIYGMSLGETDKRYWVNIINALIKNKQLYLLIVVKDDNYLPHMPSSPISKISIKKYINKFLNYADDLSNDQAKDLSKKIVVSTQYNIF